MVENNEKGKEARKYFIEVEKGYKLQLTNNVRLIDMMTEKMDSFLIDTNQRLRNIEENVLIRLPVQKSYQDKITEMYSDIPKPRGLNREFETLHGERQVLHNLINKIGAFGTYPNIHENWHERVKSVYNSLIEYMNPICLDYLDYDLTKGVKAIEFTRKNQVDVFLEKGLLFLAIVVSYRMLTKSDKYPVTWIELD